MGIIKQAYNSKVWKGVRKVTGDRYGRFNSKSKTLGYNIPKIVSDVKALGTMINAEKKRQETSTGLYYVAQNLNLTSSGHSTTDLTPVISQGVTYNTRNGSSIKLHSTVMKFQMIQQANQVTDMRVKIYIFKTTGIPSAFNIANFLDVNPFNNRYDFNSSRNIDKMPQFKILQVKNVKIKGDAVANVPNQIEFMIAWKHKGDSHIRYDKDTNVVTKGQIYMVMVADNGDYGTPNSGVTVQHTLRHFYYDN